MGSNDTRDRLFELLGAADARHDAWNRERKLLASLLRGELQILGCAVEPLRFVDGPPGGMTNEQLALMVDNPSEEPL